MKRKVEALLLGGLLSVLASASDLDLGVLSKLWLVLIAIVLGAWYLFLQQPGSEPITSGFSVFPSFRPWHWIPITAASIGFRLSWLVSYHRLVVESFFNESNQGKLDRRTFFQQEYQKRREALQRSFKLFPTGWAVVDFSETETGRKP